MSWSRILGHERLVAGFRNVMERGRLAHAYLFSGPTGVGKHLFARELAKALLCEAPGKAPDSLDACDRCASCLLVQAHTHPDCFTVVKPEDKNEFPISIMREFCAGFSLTSARGHGKVMILDDADDLNDEAANCFLKTLEEPPPRSVLILVSTSSDRQLPTIQSRCQVVRFAPLKDEQVRTILKDRDIQDATLLDRLTQLAGGSPGQALELADPALWDFRKELLGGLAHEPIETISLAKNFVEFVEDAGKEGALQRRRASLVIRLLVEALRDTLTMTVGGKPKSADADELRLLRTLTARATTDKLLALLERCLQTEQQINRYVQLTLVLEGLIDALAQVLEEGVRSEERGVRT